MTEKSVEYDAMSEVRFAVVLYGGVSLAIYMNGIVQELFELVRATAPPAFDADGADEERDDQGDDANGGANAEDSETREVAVDDADLSGSGRVYRELGRRDCRAGR